MTLCRKLLTTEDEDRTSLLDNIDVMLFAKVSPVCDHNLSHQENNCSVVTRCYFLKMTSQGGYL